MMKFLKILLITITLINFGCTQKKEDVVVKETYDLQLEMSGILKYFFAGDVLTTETVYSPQGINFGQITLNQEISKNILIKNSPIIEDFYTDIKIDEKDPKIFSIETNNCNILKSDTSCSFKIKAKFTDALFTSTKTARLIFGKKDGVELYTELSAQIRNIDIMSSQFESNYSISINKNFNTDYSQFAFQEREITVKNNSSTKFIRNDYIIPRIVGSNPTDFYISSNQCMYPVPANGTCKIRVIYKKWKTTSQVADTEIKFPNKSQNFSLKYGMMVTYDPVYSDWGTCSAESICSGSGTQTRIISDCIKNGLYSTDVSNCSGNVMSQPCLSPAGNRDINISGGVKTQSCSQGSTTWVDNSVNCSSDYHAESMSCIPDVFVATFSNYTPSSNPLVSTCSGQMTATRTIVSCKRFHNNEIVSNSKCSDPDASIIYKSPFGTRTINISGGTQDQSCNEGSTTWNILSTNCNIGYYKSGNSCLPIQYVATYSDYSSSSSESTVCAGEATVSRSIVSCKQSHDNLIVSNSFCTDPTPTKVVLSPSGSRIVSLFDSLTSNEMGSQSQFCQAGSTTWVPTSTSCFQYYSVNGNTCLANELASPYSNTIGEIYSNQSSFSFNVTTDFNATDLVLYSDLNCSSQIGSGVSLGLTWNVNLNFTQNVLTTIYAKSKNSSTLKESQCSYLFSYMYDNSPPSGTLSLNSGSSSTTKNYVNLNFSNLSENTGVSNIIGMKVYESNNCSGDESFRSFNENEEFYPLAKGTNVSVSVKLLDTAQNESNCITDSIFFGMTISSKYNNGQNWMDYVDPSTGSACSGSGNCIHGGEKKIVNLDETSCNSLSLVDNFDFFSWECENDPVNLGKVRFHSKQINKDKKLADLINMSPSISWKDFKVDLYRSTELINSSVGTPLYTNLLNEITGSCYQYIISLFFASSAPDPASCHNNGSIYYWILASTSSNPSITGAAGTINVVRKVDQSASEEIFDTQSLNLSSDKIGLVLQNGVKLSPRSTSITPLSLSARKYNYIEGNFYGKGNSASAINLSNSSYIFINNSYIENFSNGITLTNSSYNKLNNNFFIKMYSYPVSISSSSNNILTKNSFASNSSPAYFTNSSYNFISEAYVINSSVDGIFFSSSNNNTLINSTFSNNNGTSISFSSSNSNIISGVISASNGNGIFFNNSSNNRLTNINAINNTNYGIKFSTSSGGNILNNILLLNNQEQGIYAISSDRNLYSNIFIQKSNGINANSGGLVLDSSLNNKFESNLVSENNSSNCKLLGTSVSNALSGVDLNCNITGLSNSGLLGSISPSVDYSSFETNLSFISFIYNISTFVRTSDQFSVYQKNYNNFDSSSYGRCSSGDCIQQSFALTFSDSKLRGRLHDLSSISQSTISNGLTCPSQISGEKYVSNGVCIISSNFNSNYKDLGSCVSNSGQWSSLDTTPSTYSVPKYFLKNATEILDINEKGYGFGNHDGLCESGESCFYSSNIGFYQGENLTNSCTFDSNDGLSDILIWGFNKNGR